MCGLDVWCCWGSLRRPHGRSPPSSATPDKVPQPSRPPYHGDQAQRLLHPEWWASAPCQPVDSFQQGSRELLEEPGHPPPPVVSACSPRPTEGPRAARPEECGPLPGLNVCHSGLLSSSPAPPHQGPATPVTCGGNPHQEPSRGGRQLSGSRPGLVAGPRTAGG